MKKLAEKSRVLLIFALTFAMVLGTAVNTQAADGKSDTPEITLSKTSYTPEITLSKTAYTPKITLSKTAYTWNGKEKRPSVTVKAGSTVLKKDRDYTVSYRNNINVGEATVKVVLKGSYQGSAAASFRIRPKGTALKTLRKSAGELSVTWKKQAERMSDRRITGYQVQIAANKNFSKEKESVLVQGYQNTSVTFSDLKSGIRYYVRIRTYKRVNNKNYYSGWSEIKSKKDQTEPEPTPDPRPEPDPLPAPVFTANDLKLADAMYAESNTNTIISPTSVDLVLAMLLEGAEGTSRTELENYLGITKEELDDYVGPLLRCAFDDGELRTTISNAFWHKPEQIVEPSYTQKLTDLYDAEIGELDFQDAENAANIINTWCSEKTNGLIPRIVMPEQVAGMADVILNTVYFKNHWREPVEKGSVTTGEFYGFDSTSNVEYLHSNERVVYENDQAIAFEKPYKEKYSFVGILPKNEGDFTLESLNLPSLMQNRSTDYEAVFVTMPKFSIESGGDITEILQALGIQQSFTAGADFTGISEELMLSTVVHKTKMILDEEGTEAAAATAAMARDTAVLWEGKTIRIELTRPYAFLIVNNETGAVLFMGKVTNP